MGSCCSELPTHDEVLSTLKSNGHDILKSTKITKLGSTEHEGLLILTKTHFMFRHCSKTAGTYTTVQPPFDVSLASIRKVEVVKSCEGTYQTSGDPHLLQVDYDEEEHQQRENSSSTKDNAAEVPLVESQSAEKTKTTTSNSEGKGRANGKYSSCGFSFAKPGCDDPKIWFAELERVTSSSSREPTMESAMA